MQIRVNTITGKSIEITADSVADLKSAIFSQMGIPIEEQKLLSNGKLLSDENLSSNVQLIISLEGGAKGKKKKQTNKKAKKKHVHKKEKLRILKCYKVDGEKDNKYYSLIRNEKGTEIGKTEWKKFEDEKVTNLYLDQNIYDKNVYNEVFDDINSRILIYKGIHS